MKRGVGIWFCIALTAMLGAALACGRKVDWQQVAQKGGLAIKVQARPVDLDPKGKTTGVGRLRYLGGLELRSRDPRFGGFSALWVSADGRELVALSDRGWWLRGEMHYGPGGRLSGLVKTRLGRLLGPNGKVLPMGKGAADVESLAPLPKGGMLVSLERDHRLLAYPGLPPAEGRPRSLAPPPWLRFLPSNQGLEAIARLSDGRFLLVSEYRRPDGRVAAALGRPGAWQRLYYRCPTGFGPTAAAGLPGGGAVLLERAFHMTYGLRIRVILLRAGDLRAGAEARPRLWALIKKPLTVDNFEGLAARRGSKGRVLLYLISDDNYSVWQRTLLMLFRARP